MSSKFWLTLFGLVVLGIEFTVQTQNICTVAEDSHLEEIAKKQKELDTNCETKLKAQIQTELRASVQYLAMSANFLTDKNYRPGAAGFFLKNAKEERAHAKKFMEYLLLRGSEIDSKTIPSIELTSCSWSTLKEAFETALTKEREVTSQINGIILDCEGESKDVTDYHAVDYLTGEFLREQHESEREILGHLATLGRLSASSSRQLFAELLFDKTFLQ